MTKGRELGEATAIAALYDEVGNKLVGYVYQWETGEISLLISIKHPKPTTIRPALDEKVIESARSKTTPQLLAFISKLQTLKA